MNTGLKKYETADVSNFTSNAGLKFRKAINPLWRNLLKLFISRKVHLEAYPRLNRKKAYLFVANHSFDEDAISVLANIDRNVYMLQGTTDQTEHNPVFLAMWANGMIYVNRMDGESRKAAVEKMKRVLRAGNSVVLFPEGGYNNTENHLIMPLFHSPYIISKELGIEVVPMICFNDIGSKDIYIRVGAPMNLAKYDREEAMAVLRDEMSAMLWDIIEKHTQPMKRCEFEPDSRLWWMEIRKKIYECQKWHGDVWDEELTFYPGHGVTTPVQARAFVENVKVNSRNAAVLVDMLVRHEEDKKYDLKEYLRRTIKLQGR